MSNNVDSRPRKTAIATLAIDNFSKLDSCKHANFMINEHSLYFGFHPKAVIYSYYEYSYVYLLNRSTHKAFNFNLKASILNSKGDKVYTKEYDGAFDDKNNEFFISFIPHSQIVPENEYLYYDKLTLFCEFEMFDHGPKNQNKNSVDSVQQDLNNLSVDFQTLLNDGKFRDATLVAGKDGKELHVHKTILIARSPVFAAMFEHDCEEKRLNKVTITDIDQEVCEEMVRYIYTGKVQSLDRYAMDLLEVADKYQLDSLKTLCELYLSFNLSIETAANVLILADMHRAVNLKTKCIDYISDNASKMKDTDGWKVLNSSKPQLLGELFLHLASKTNR